MWVLILQILIDTCSLCFWCWLWHWVWDTEALGNPDYIGTGSSVRIFDSYSFIIFFVCVIWLPIHMCSLVSMYVWTPKVDIWRLSQLLSTLYIEAKSLTGTQSSELKHCGLEFHLFNFDITHLFICVLLESPLWKALYLSLSFKWIVFLLLNCRWSLYILDTKCLLDPWFGNTFLKSYWCASCSVHWSQSQVWMDALMPMLCLNNSFILLCEMLCLHWGWQSLDSHSVS